MLADQRQKSSSSTTTPREKEGLALLTAYRHAVEAGRKVNGGYLDGGVVDLRDNDKEVILVGDLHGNSRNLGQILRHNNNFRKLQDGNLIVCLLGDQVHNDVVFTWMKNERDYTQDEEAHLADMTSSLSISQLCMRLKVKFPKNFYTLAGNHDIPSMPAFKGKTNQTEKFRVALSQSFGDDFLAQYVKESERLPFLVIGNKFVGVHAGPVHFSEPIDLNTFTYATSNRQVKQAALWSRLSVHGGYQQKDVARFLRRLKLPAGSTLFTGHSPYDNQSSSWRICSSGTQYVLYAANNTPGYAQINQLTGDFKLTECTDSAQQSAPRELRPRESRWLEYNKPLKVQLTLGHVRMTNPSKAELIIGSKRDLDSAGYRFQCPECLPNDLVVINPSVPGKAGFPLTASTRLIINGKTLKHLGIHHMTSERIFEVRYLGNRSIEFIGSKEPRHGYSVSISA